MAPLYFTAQAHSKVSGSIVVSALILTDSQKERLNCMVASSKLPVVVDHATNGLTHIYSVTPENIYQTNVDLIWTLKSILAPNQYARIMKLHYSPDLTFSTVITDISVDETLPVRDNFADNFRKSLSHEWTADMDVDIEDVTDALTQIPKSEQHKILEFSGIKEWRSTTVEEWTGTSLFQISEENLAELKKHFTDLYDWGVGSGTTDIRFHKVTDQSGASYYAITGVFADHANLNEDYIVENNLNYDDFEESIELYELLAKYAEPDQEINITVAGLDSKKCYLFVSDYKI